MSVIDVPEPNLTLVAFYRKNKPDEFKHLVDTVRKIVETKTCMFTPYEEEQLHATIIGMEVVKLGGKSYNANFLNSNGTLKEMGVKRLIEFLKGIAASRKPLFTIRFGGFAEAKCTCSGHDLLDWPCPTSPKTSVL